MTFAVIYVVVVAYNLGFKHVYVGNREYSYILFETWQDKVNIMHFYFNQKKLD